MADCGLPQLLIGQAIIPVIGCIRIGVIERPELVIGKCLIRKQWGKWSLLLCWVPIIGDPLTLMGGVLRTQFWFFLSVVACTKTLRYGVIVYYFY